MSDAEAIRLELEEKEKELEDRKRKLEEREKELEGKKDRKDKNKKAKDAKKQQRKDNLRKMNEEAQENAERLKKQQQLLEEALKDSEESDSSSSSTAQSTPESTKNKKKKRSRRQKRLKTVSLSGSEEEDKRKFTLQARTKVPSLDKGMTYAKYKNNVDMWKHSMKGYMMDKDMGMTLLQALPDEDNRGGLKAQAWKKLGIAMLASKSGVTHLLDFLDKKLLKTDFVRCIELNDRHMAIRHQDGWSIDRYIAEAQQVWDQIKDLGYSVPAPMKCATLIRGLNLTDTQVHLIASKLSIGAADLEEQVVEAIKAFTDTNRVLTKNKETGRSKNDANPVNIAEDALGYRIEEDETEEALFARNYGGGACLFCKKKGHFKKDCIDFKEKINKIKAYKESKGEKWISPRKYGEMKKAQLEKKDKAQTENKDKGTYLAQPSSVVGKTLKLYDEKKMEEDTDYESYIATAYSLVTEENVEENEISVGRDEQTFSLPLNSFPNNSAGVGGGGGALLGPHGGGTDTSLHSMRRERGRENEEEMQNASEDGIKEVEVLFTEKEAEILFLEDNRDTAILDTGCARSTAGEDWIESHIEHLSQEDRLDIKEKEGSTYFRFGNGKRFKSKKFLIMPVYFGGQRAMMGMDMIDAKIPLLISLAAMKRAKTVITTATDTVVICGKKIKLRRVGGHYTISLRKRDSQEEDREEEETIQSEAGQEEENENLLTKVLDDPDSWKAQLKKLHNQMCHVPARRMKTNLERGGVWKPEMEEILFEIEKNCKVNDCRSRAGGQRGRKPAVSFPRATRVGQSVAMDLKVRHNKGPILYMVDQFSRFTLGVILRNKELTTVSEAVITHWIGAGYPMIKNIHTDNGGEFCGEVANKVATIIGATRVGFS